MKRFTSVEATLSYAEGTYFMLQHLLEDAAALKCVTGAAGLDTLAGLHTY